MGKAWPRRRNEKDSDKSTEDLYKAMPRMKEKRKKRVLRVVPWNILVGGPRPQEQETSRRPAGD
jgi:type VI protein secretion system component VasK